MVDPEPEPYAWDPLADLLDLAGERTVEHDGDDVGVVPQVHQLVGGIPVVRVDRRHSGLEAAEYALDVLGAVVEVLGDLVLFDQPGVEQGAGDAVGAGVELRPCHGAVTLLLGEFTGDLIGDPLEDVGEVPTRGSHGGDGTGVGARSEIRRAVAQAIDDGEGGPGLPDGVPLGLQPPGCSRHGPGGG